MDRIIYDGTIFEAGVLFNCDSDLYAPILETKDGVFDFRGEYYIDDYYFSGSRDQWKEEHGRHWLNKKARRIHTSDGVIIDNTTKSGAV